MPAPAPPEPVLEPEPELLSFGPVGPSRAGRRLLAVLAVMVVLAIGAYAVVRVLPHRAPDLTLVDLQGVYGGMVRADGTNEVSLASRDQAADQRERIVPDGCSPLFDFTLSNQFPATAIDGVSTFWLNEGQASISLVTYRYPDKASAQADFDRISTALDACTGRQVRASRHLSMSLSRQQVPAPGRVDGSVAYLVSSGPGQGRFSTNVAWLDNTVTWQYRYDYQSPATYTTLPAEQLMSTLFTLMQSAQDAHR